MGARATRILLITGGTLLAAIGVVLAARIDRDRVPGHAYSIPSADNRILVEVLNGNGRQGLARAVTRVLREQGLDVTFFGTGNPTDSTRILVRRGDLGQGRHVAKALGFGEDRVVSAPDSLLRIDVTVLLGADFRLADPLHP